MNKQDVIAFFNRCAPVWDARMIRNESAINTILENGGIRAGVNVLDVACGTGVLFPDYLRRQVHSVTGVDISPEMVRIASKKFPDGSVRVIVGDIESIALPQPFDCCMVYNALPHFPDPARLVRRLAGLLTSGGRLSIAHGMSRDHINSLHHGAALAVSSDLMPAKALAALFTPYFDVDIVLDNDYLYQVSGIKKTLADP